MLHRVKEDVAMATLKKFSFYQLFPIISVTCLFLAKFYEDNYPYRNPNRIVEHIYFTLLYQGALFFFIAYLIPLFLSLKVKENTKRILKISSIFFVSFYLLISSYLFYSTNSSILLTSNFDLYLVALGGILLGITNACTHKKNDH